MYRNKKLIGLSKSFDMNKFFLTAVISFLVLISCGSKNNGTITPKPDEDKSENVNLEIWTTRGDKSELFKKEVKQFTFSSKATDARFTIEIDAAQQFQEMDGFGYTLTGGSAMLINAMSGAMQNNLLQDLFANSGDNGIGVNYIRISIGASDLDEKVFSYNDLPAGETDVNQEKFSIQQDKINLIPVLKKILTINPAIKIMATPWSAPAWMKDNNSAIGGKLKQEYYASYALYFAKYIDAMKEEGISITAVTPQNEPLHDGNNPSMKMEAEEQRDFIKNHLGAAMQSKGVKVIVYDHNADNTQYAKTIYNDADAAKYVDGAAFHLYAGDIKSLSELHNVYPDKNLYFTEQWTSSDGSFNGDLDWHMRNVITGAPNNWAKVVMQWNLANNANFGPHTEGGCTKCKGAVTIVNSTSYEKNVAYYNVAHLSKFVLPGSKRVASTQSSNNFSNTAYIRPDGKKVLVVYAQNAATFYMRLKDKNLTAAIPMTANTVKTIIW